MRQDLLGINQAEGDWDQERPRKTVKALLATLPKPQNDYTLELPQLNPLPIETPRLMDREEEMLRDVREKKLKMGKQEERQSLAVLKGLPRPRVINTTMDCSNASPAEVLIHHQVVHLLASDSVHYPLKGCKPEIEILKQTHQLQKINSSIPNSLLEEASHLIY